MAMDEAELVSRLKKDEEEAFSLLFESHRLQVFRTAYLILGSKEQAEDVMQEAFYRLWTHRKSLKEGPVLPWLLKVTTNACFSLWRRKREFPLEEELASQNSTMDPEEAVAYKEILAELNRLPKKQRAVLTLRLLLGYSEEETARILNSPEGTIRSNLFKAKENLRRKLNER